MREIHSHNPMRVRIISCFVEVLLWMGAHTIRQSNGDIPHWVESPRKYGRYSWQIEGQILKWNRCRKEVSKKAHKLWYRCISLLEACNTFCFILKTYTLFLPTFTRKQLTRHAIRNRCTSNRSMKFTLQQANFSIISLSKGNVFLWCRKRCAHHLWYVMQNKTNRNTVLILVATKFTPTFLLCPSN